MRRIVLFTLLFFAVASFAQIPFPQINVTGNVGCVGFPCVNTGTLVFSSDADRYMTAQETSAEYLKVTSSVTLTAMRNLIAPAGRFPFIIENATTGSQSIQIIGASGLGVTILNGTTVAVWNNGTDFVQVGAVGGPASGDLSGTYPSPIVAKVNGAAIPAAASIVGTNSSHQFIDASTTFLAASPILSTGYDDLSVTGYIPFSGGETAFSATEAPAQSLSPVNCTINNLRVLLTSGDQGNLTTVTVSLRQNGASSTLTCTITGNGSTGNNCVDLAHNPSVTAGDKIDWQIAVSSGLTITGNVAVSATWQCVI